MTNVNEQFAAEKRGQIEMARAVVERNRQDIANYDSGVAQAALDASLAEKVEAGTIRMIGADRYEVLEGWDRNEVFTVRRPSRPTEIPLILPESNLDMTTGEAALYSSTPAWHQLGNIIPGGISDIDKVMELGGLNWEVAQKPVRYNVGGKWYTMPAKFVNYREDTAGALGVVGDRYTPVQNREGFEFLLGMVEQGWVTWESAGALYDGRRVFASMKLPEDIVLDIEGVQEIIEPYVVFINSHDGETPFMAMATPWKPLCGNTERFAVRDAYSRWTVRHTKNAMKRMEEARRNLGLTQKYYENFKAEEEQLSRNEMALQEFDELMGELWPLGEEPTKTQQTIADKRLTQLREIYASESHRVGPTAFAAERAVTDWLDHSAPKRKMGDNMLAARATAVLVGDQDKIKNKAHEKLMLRVK